MRHAKNGGWKLLGFLLMLFLVGCLEEYTPPVTAAQTALLVVDGFINSQGITTIKLSRTASLTTTAAPPPETKATVFIEDAAGQRQTLPETSPGTYASAPLMLDPAKKYRLHLRTAAGPEYASDLQPVLTTPPIDNLYWTADGDGASIYVDAHAAANVPPFYRWDFVETWEFTSAFLTDIEYKNGRIVPRTEDVYRCWATANSTKINVLSTTTLSENTIRRHAITVVPRSSVKLYYKYSILVKQRVQSKEEYDYLTLLKKNTEDIGSIFGPLPVQLTGNMHALANADEPVIGYVGVGAETQKRIFISRGELPREWRPSAGLAEQCTTPDTIDDVRRFNGGNPLPIRRLEAGEPRAGSYLGAGAVCIDCRLSGTNVRPSFWQ
ncbi:DUF4249 domain-containing protein [Hymenobacter sp. NBH84]|uniref:DUF4249 domain-containing protein n=1 Tax=Hymenobacter sp. NBH84 TaxID=2596915 RepID=UPI0016264AA9|nr:DUF4249 domain-containing protein [Hymenobacter sp. NBH84]QNE39758.1 DUF4249 domain-containing protein [Hymenobacter sp. NBH84]